MESLIINATETTPGIVFDCEKLVHGKYIFEINGESRPEDVTLFYTPVIKWLNEYEKFLLTLRNKTGNIHKRKIRFKFRLQYFNSSSAKYFLDILRVLYRIHSVTSLADIKVIWVYDPNDEDIYDSGLEFKQLTDIPFQLSALKSGETI